MYNVHQCLLNKIITSFFYLKKTPFKKVYKFENHTSSPFDILTGPACIFGTL